MQDESNQKDITLIKPQNISELLNAINIKEKLQAGVEKSKDNYSSLKLKLLTKQESYINEYINSLGCFDNTILVNNIAYLVKKNHMRIGELEEFLGISAGYISRTIKEDSKKKISIDNVWKIAKLFDIDIKTLTENKLYLSDSNSNLIYKFIDKLFDNTKDKNYTWANHGGVMEQVNSKYVECGIILKSEKDGFVYTSDDLNHKNSFVLAKDIMCLKNFDKNNDLVIIPFLDEGNTIFYDFIFISNDESKNCWQKAFGTKDTMLEYLNEHADSLYKLIEHSEFDVKLESDIQQIIFNFIDDKAK